MRSIQVGPVGSVVVRRHWVTVAAAASVVGFVAWWFLSGASSSASESSSAPDSAAGAPVARALAYSYFAAIGIVLARIDIQTHRLPNAIVLPGYVVGGVLLTIASAASGEWSALLRALIGMATLYAFYFVLRLLRPGGMGGGDVKLAGVIGLFLAYQGWGSLMVGAFSAFLLGGLFGVALIVLRHASRTTAIPFGPWMLAGAWVGIFAGETIASGYTLLLLPG